MFVPKKDRVIWWPVDVEIPVDGGDVEKDRFEAQFDLIGQAQIDRLVNLKNGDHALLTRVVKGWRGVGQEGGGDLEFSSANLETLLDISYVRRAINRAFFNATYGAKAKNSETPPADGQAAEAPETSPAT